MARLLPGLCLTMVLVLATACGPDKTEGIILRIAHPLDSSHPNHQTLEFFAQDLAQRSSGAMAVELYPGGQLGNSREVLELLQVGSLDITVASAASVESFVPAFRLFGLPYLFRDRMHRLEVFRSPIGQELLESGIPARLRGLAYLDAGSRSFYTKDAVVRSPDDLKGKKIRVMNSPMAIAGIRALGASPTPIAWGELYTALQQGVVDAAENNPPSFLTSRHYEITPYFSLDEHTSIPDLIVIGEASWQRLSPQQQEWVQAAAQAAAEFQYELWAEAVEEALTQLEAANITIHRPDKAPFIEAVQPLYEALRASAPELFKLVEAIRHKPAATP
ncbi:MAG: TRAP transporter substrate-binding protein [Opitutales bacterium]